MRGAGTWDINSDLVRFETSEQYGVGSNCWRGGLIHMVGEEVIRKDQTNRDLMELLQNTTKQSES